MMFETATLRSGYTVPDTLGFAERIERMLRSAMDISPDAKVKISNLLTDYKVYK